MVSEELLSILACPHSKLPLEVADSAVINELNTKIKKKEIKTIGGVEVTNIIEEALIEPENKIVYIIESNIPNLIYEEGIQIP